MRARLRRLSDRLRRNPLDTVIMAQALVRGLAAVIWYRLTTRRVRIGWPLYIVHGWIHVQGPGHVRIGRHCLVDVSAHQALNIVTLHPDASVEIGDRCRLAGATLRCAQSICIAPRVMTGYCLVQDVEMPSSWLSPGVQPEPARPVVLGEAAWVTRQAILLPGTDVGPGAVVGVASVCRGLSLPALNVVSGNPPLRPVPISGLAAFGARS